MKDLMEILKEKRPNLSVSSLYSYSSTLRGLHKRVFGDCEIDIDDFNKVDEIMKDLETKPPSVRKTTAAILFVATENPAYQELMKNDIQQYKKDVDKQEMSEKQKENYLTQEEIMTKFKQLEKEAKALYKKESLTAKEKQQIQDYIIVALTSGIFIPPRRSLDWVQFKIKNIGETDNHLQKNKFVFKTYKGSAKKGEQNIDAPKPLLTILNKWIAINDNDYLLHDIKGQPLSAIKMTQRLNKIFGKHASINALRHSFLSEKYQDTISLAKDMEEMGSSKAQAAIYIQKL